MNRLLPWLNSVTRPIGRRGAVAVMFSVAMLPMLIGVLVAIDLSRMVDGRAAMQRIVDNAALSGAAAYTLYTPKDSFKAIATNVANSTFCNTAVALPAGLKITTSGGGSACASGVNGPVVTGVIGGYTAGSGTVNAKSGCSATKSVVVGAQCGFLVTVSAQATMNTLSASLFGATRTVTVSATAANPFINLATALTPTVASQANNANSLWVYPVLLDANGQPDYTTDNGALPDITPCTTKQLSPDVTSCGSYSMLASTKYYQRGCNTAAISKDAKLQASCTVNGALFSGTTGGVVQNPVTNNVIYTATTPMGFAMVSAGGGTIPFFPDYADPPIHPDGTPDGKSPTYGGPPPAPPNAINYCVFPGRGSYNTINQLNDAQGNPMVPWDQVTHWFYSSFLVNNLPPSQRELDEQASPKPLVQNGKIIATFTQDVEAYAAPHNPDDKIKITQPRPPDCPARADYRNHNYITWDYPATGKTNCSVYIVKDSQTGLPNPSYINNHVCFTPQGTQGRQYGVLSCQNFQGHTFTMFWNDMGGLYHLDASDGDDTDYYNGSLRIACNGPTRVVLVQ